jgi:hypothetical protein
MANAPTWLEQLRYQLAAAAGALWGEMQEQGLRAYLQPVGPYNAGLAAPLATVAGIVGIVFLSGVAVAGLTTALLALLALWMLLSEVFGFSFELSPVFATRR